jgi:phage terminase large subunit-like protein
MNGFWPAQARTAQTPPSNERWKTWLFLGGRGAGKTHAGAGWLNGQAVKGARLALVGATLNDVREVMIEGPSGLRAITDDEDRPTYQSSRRRLVWPNGAVAHAFSAEEPERLRGPQFHAAWCDEFCAWPRAGETLALLRLGLRRGSDPRLVVTTTPRPSAALRRLMAEPGVVITRAGTADNAENLAPDFVASLEALYGGTRLAAQELDGLVVEAGADALWRAEDLARLRCAPPDRFDRIVVAVDPPISANGDACGLIVAGRADGIAYVLEDGSARGLGPIAWARRAADLARRWKVDKVVAEANQGGEMVSTMLAMAECPAPVRLVHARLSKRARAEPVAALYEQGKVRHAGTFAALEEEMLALGGDGNDLTHSPDRADAMVWAITELMLERRAQPRLSIL